MKVAICTGKTGGHVFPALAVAHLLKEKSHTPFFIGTRQGLDKGILEKEGICYKPISGCGLPPRPGLKTLKWGATLSLGLAQVRRIFKKNRPDVVLSFGGYISTAPVLVARSMQIPVVIHESNVQPGRANRFLSRWVQSICTSFPIHWPSDCEHLVQVTGLPIRERFLDVDRTKSFQALGLDPNRFVVLVMGGSLGSRRINECLVDALHDLGDLSKKIQILHVTGKNDYSRVVQHYEPNGIFYRAYPFIDEVEYAFHSADLFIGRAGASTLAEITLCGLPSILIPYPQAIEDHQTANAAYLAQEGAARVLDESQISPRVLADEIIRLVLNDRLRSSLAENSKKLGISDGVSRIVKVLESVVS